MGKSKKSLRDATRLSGRPLSETLIPSPVLASTSEQWVTSPDLTEYNLPYASKEIIETTRYLLENPGLSSSVLFRADVLGHRVDAEERQEQVVEKPAREFPGFELDRTLVRRLIPRNRELDAPLVQTCHLYRHEGALAEKQIWEQATAEGRPVADARTGTHRFMVVYTPHVDSKEEMPYYHPLVRSLAVLYEYDYDLQAGLQAQSRTQSQAPEDEQRSKGAGTVSIHFVPWDQGSITNRLERSLGRLIEVQMRTTAGRVSHNSTESLYSSIKDSVIPRDRMQDTYSRLKSKYAADLTKRWVESTEPSKHVFEDLGIAAFLVELWRDLYSVLPGYERKRDSDSTSDEDKEHFPGFVDIACGNGVLVYILISEGYAGWGFDARRRKTWSIFPSDVQERLKEEIYIPKPFADSLSTKDQNEDQKQLQAEITQSSPTNLEPGEASNGAPTSGPGTPLSTLPPNTFIISNHADELTLWTPLIAALLNPTNPPPFLAVPCCSHTLSGARHRFAPRKQSQSQPPASATQQPDKAQGEKNVPETGDLKAMRKAKLTESDPHNTKAFSASTYGALTDKLIETANEIATGIKTLLRIPSTRNIGIVGGLAMVKSESQGEGEGEPPRARLTSIFKGSKSEEEKVLARVMSIVERECTLDGGVEAAAKTWIDGARKLQSNKAKASKH
ncbi:hypothetical protein BDW74DRAFT_185556 [Aspergillus multicolor]|uniref:tRNA (uracil) methyltransferase n=1 Tax=Aspergillus multicolor TaxID=41759 RepID=UPI003CCE4B48